MSTVYRSCAMRPLLFALCVDLFLAACGGGGGSGGDDGGSDASSVDGTIHVDDGTPMRKPCVSSFGSALVGQFGRLDGYLVAIVQPGSGGCNADSDHVHLQIEANGARYDVAINVGTPGGDVTTTTREMSFAAWDEGWHDGIAYDYVALGLHSGDFTVGTRTQLAAELTTELANVNHISIFATPYDTGGAHLVHRNFEHDGIVVTQPLSSPAHARMYAFTTQTF